MRNCADARILAAAWLFALSTSCAAVLPYGASHNDTSFSSRDDDACDAIATRQMPFFGTQPSVLYVCTNGLVSFDEPHSGYVESDMPIDGRDKIVAPFWSDVDLRLGGDILFRVSYKMEKLSELDQLDAISREVRELKMVEFYGTWFVAVTWLNVRGFGAPAAGGQGTNTFQLVLVTDGESTYSIFNYEQISWDRTISSPRRAQAGANGAINNFYILVNDGKNLTELARNSNVGITGKWIYRVDFKDYRECYRNPCKNGGSCSFYMGSYNCACLRGYSGLTCEMVIDYCRSTPCQHGGVCNRVIGDFTCNCNRNYTGKQCETETDFCESDPCQNGATCTPLLGTYNCTCSFGYTGSNCEEVINYCRSSLCKNGGTCQSLVGSYSCACRAGYIGADCAAVIDNCASRPCQNNGICFNAVNSYSCSCRSGYTGRTCETAINYCQINPCRNSGSCTSIVGGYSCACTPGYTGSDCSTGGRGGGGGK